MATPTTANALHETIAAAIPGRQITTTEGSRTRYPSIRVAATLEHATTDQVTLTALLGEPSVTSLEITLWLADGCAVRLACPVTIGQATRLLARTLVTMNDASPGTLYDALIGNAPLPRPPQQRAGGGIDDPGHTVNRVWALDSSISRAMDDEPFASPVILASEREEILATLIADLLGEYGWRMDSPYDARVTEAFVSALPDHDDPMAIATALAGDPARQQSHP